MFTYCLVLTYGLSLVGVQLSHKSFRCPKWLEFTLAYCGALAFEGDPIEWSKNHNWCDDCVVGALRRTLAPVASTPVAERCDASGVGVQASSLYRHRPGPAYAR